MKTRYELNEDDLDKVNGGTVSYTEVHESGIQCDHEWMILGGRTVCRKCHMTPEEAESATMRVGYTLMQG